MENPEFLKQVAAAKRPVLLSTGAVPEVAVREALDLNAGPVALLYGPQEVPAPAEELRLRDLAAWRERYRVPVGVLDQTDGAGAFALLAPALAAAHGAAFVEKAFALDRTRQARDHAAALSPEDFYRMVELLRQAERAHGDGPRPPAEDERQHRAFARSVVAGTLIGRGDVLTAAMLAYKRADGRSQPGFPPREAHRVIGRRAARPIQADEVIREDMLE
jgi:sialic acid synthase SpsE